MPILFFKGIRYPFAYGKVAILSLNLQVSECIIFMISSYVVNEGLFVSQNLTTIRARMARRFQVLTLHVIIDIRTPFAGITAHGADPEARGGVLHHHPGYLGFQILTYKNPFIIFHQIFIFLNTTNRHHKIWLINLVIVSYFYSVSFQNPFVFVRSEHVHFQGLAGLGVMAAVVARHARELNMLGLYVVGHVAPIHP